MKFKLIRFKYLGVTRYTVANEITSNETSQLSIYSFIPKDELDKVLKEVRRGTYGFFRFNYESINSFEILCEFNAIEEIFQLYPEYFI
jgi:hypothetical protein